MWMKWHHKWADGPGEDNWVIISHEEDAEELSYEYSQEYNYADLYRGISYEVLETAPKEIINREFEKQKQYLEIIQARVDNLQKQLESK